MKRRSFKTTVISGAIGLLFLAVGIAALSNDGSRAVAGDNETQGTKITIDNFSFTPAEVTVPVGATVTWVNHDDVPHTVVSNDKKFKSKALDTDDTFSFTFSQAGTYEYYCSVHPKMTAKVTVK
jgi:plastocyanin